MSSLRKIDANRENGKLGGPKTPEGKAIASLNAIKHGLAGNVLVLTNESRPMYNALLDGFIARFKPADEVEADLVVEMVNNRWRLRRIWSIETAMLDLEMDDQEDDIAADRGDIDEIVRIALAFKSLAEAKGLALLNRYEARLRRQYNDALANLRQLQAERPNPDQTNQSSPHPMPATQNDQTNPPSDRTATVPRNQSPTSQPEPAGEIDQTNPSASAINTHPGAPPPASMMGVTVRPCLASSVCG